jgi:hypothetical protein
MGEITCKWIWRCTRQEYKKNSPGGDLLALIRHKNWQHCLFKPAEQYIFKKTEKEGKYEKKNHLHQSCVYMRGDWYNS